MFFKNLFVCFSAFLLKVVWFDLQSKKMTGESFNFGFVGRLFSACVCCVCVYVRVCVSSLCLHKTLCRPRSFPALSRLKSFCVEIHSENCGVVQRCFSSFFFSINQRAVWRPSSISHHRIGSVLKSGRSNEPRLNYLFRGVRASSEWEDCVSAGTTVRWLTNVGVNSW